MGSFVGHIDEAIFFMLLAIWWMVNIFPRHIRSVWEKRDFMSTRVSYPLPCKRQIPLEAIMKTLFPFAGLIGEISSEGPAFIDSNGNFRKLEQMQHMTIYGLFIVHGLIDVAMSYGAPLPRGADFLTAAVCFFWYGLSFSFHAHMHGKAQVETMVHVLPIYVMYACAVAGLIELCRPHWFGATVVRTYCLLVLGTWFCHVAFILYKPFPWPGSYSNPAWDMSDERNVHFIVAAFGFHLLLHVVVLAVVYLATYAFLRLRRDACYEFKPLLTSEKCDDESIEM